MGRSHYQLLGVAPHATHEEVRRAYRRLAQQHHPDANPDAPDEARALMAEINQAWEVLGDQERRRVYDLAIGVTPRPRLPFRFEDEHEEGGEDGDPLSHLRDDPGVPARPQRPSDLLVAIPVFLFVLAVVTFAFSAMSGNESLRNASMAMAPVTAGSFVAAPLFMMLRNRDRDRDRS
ncbi:MAG TPA: J domain-containing protein [Acidimicrobiales bacterium]